MAISQKHSVTAVGTDDPDSQVSVDAWNDEHVIIGAPDSFFTFDATGAASDAIPVSAFAPAGNYATGGGTATGMNTGDQTSIVGIAGTLAEFNAAITDADIPQASTDLSDAASLYKSGGTDVALADGGTGTSLADPGADRLLFWDDSAGVMAWLTLGTNLSITGTTIDATGGGGGGMSDPYVPPDGTMNVTGGIAASGSIAAGGDSSVFGSATDGQIKLLVKGSARALRLGTGANYASLEATDQTGTASYEHLLIGGSSVAIHSGGPTVAEFTAAGLDLTGALDTTGKINGITFEKVGSNYGFGAGLPTGIAGFNNISVGEANSLAITTGESNVVVGNYALIAETSGNENTAIGHGAGLSQSGGSTNTYLGTLAGQTVTTGDANTIVGRNAGNGITTGGQNTVIGANVTGLAAGTANNVILADGAGTKRFWWDGATIELNGPTEVVGSVVATGAVTGSNLSGTNTGDQTSIVGITGTLAQFNTAITDDNLVPASGGTFTGDISVPDEAYGAGWDSSLEVPTKNALYDKLQTLKTGATTAIHVGTTAPASPAAGDLWVDTN